MRKKHKDLWLAALRSGHYRQGTEAMCIEEQDNAGITREHFCCLGVLSDVLIQEEQIPAYWDTSLGSPIKDLTYRDRSSKIVTSSHFPTLAMRAELRLDKPLVQRLAQLNDKGATFEELANAIEALPNLQPINELIEKYRTEAQWVEKFLGDEDIQQWMLDAPE